MLSMDHIRNDPDAIRRALGCMLLPGQVTEVRALGVIETGYRAPHTVSGYFDDIGMLADAVVHLNDATGINFVPNRVDPALLARAANRVRPVVKGGHCTGDGDIVRRHWLLVDLDPVRPSGISATDVEREAARDRSRAVHKALRSAGWPAPIAADSGNGFHLLFRVDLPADDDGLVQACLESLAKEFDDDAVKIDTSVHNPARIWKLYGTAARKGDTTPDRPHRLAKIVHVPNELEIVREELLLELAGARKQTSPQFSQSVVVEKVFDLSTWISKHKLDVKEPEDWRDKDGRLGRRWEFGTCPWNGDHTDDSAFIVQFEGGAIAAGCHHNGCAGKDWHDLRNVVEPGWRPGKPSSQTRVSIADASWEPPVPLMAIQSAPPFPIDQAFPGTLTVVRDFVIAVAESLQVPVDLPAMLVLPVASLALAQKAEVEPAPGWREPSALWTLTLAESGERKSATVRRMLAPLHAWERDEAERLAPQIAEQQERRNIEESRLKGLRKSAGRADEDDNEDARQAIALAQSLEAETLLSAPQLQTTEPTTEAVAGLLVRNHERLVVASAEADAMDVMLGRYSGGAPNFGIWLSGHAGDAYRVDRRGREPDHLHRPALSVALAVQPDSVMDMFSSRQARGRGLIARFLKAAPISMLGRRNIDAAPVPASLGAGYAKVIRRLLDMPIEDQSPVIVTFSKQARGEFDEFRQMIEPELGRNGHLGDRSDWGGKLCGAVARIALALHGLAEWGNCARSANSVLIGVKIMRAALSWAPYLIEHERIVSRLVGCDMAVAVADRILRWLEQTKAEAFTRRDAFTSCRSGDIKKTEDIDPALDVLMEHGYVRRVESLLRSGPGRKPSPQFMVNPLSDKEAAS